MSMPFLIGAVYLIVSALQVDNRKSMYAKLCAAGALIFLGYKVKGSLIILFAVGLLLLFLKFRLKSNLPYSGVYGRLRRDWIRIQYSR